MTNASMYTVYPGPVFVLLVTLNIGDNWPYGIA